MSDRISEMTNGGPLRFTDQIPVLRAGNNFRVTAPSYANDAYIVVKTTADPVANGIALIQAYQDASALNPGGQPIGENNRAVVILPPGVYEFVFSVPDDEWQVLGMLNNYVDLVGLTGDPKHVIVTSACDAADSGTLAVVANYAAIKGITVRNTGETRGTGASSEACALFTFVAQQGVIFTDCIFDDGGGLSWSMRQGTTIDSQFVNCVAVDFAFGAHGGNFTGIALNCTARNNVFGSAATFSGLAIDCTAGEYAFGSDEAGGTFSGKAVRCTALFRSFGGGQNNGVFSGWALDCTAGSNSFGASTFSGRAERCVSASASFGLNVCSGIMIDCTMGTFSFGGLGSFTGQNIRPVLADLQSPADPVPVFFPWGQAWAPTEFTGKVTSAVFAPDDADLNGAKIPDGATGEFEFCTFRKTGTGTPLALDSGSATIKFSYCKFNTVAGIAAGITNALGATLAAAFNIGDVDV